MIRIQEHLNIDNADLYLDNLAKELWIFLNPMKVNKNEFKKSSLIKKLNALLELVDNPEYFKKYANNSRLILFLQKEFLEYLKNNSYEKLKLLVISRPSDLLKLKNEILGLSPINIFYSNKEGKLGQTNFGKLLSEKLFNYSGFRGTQFCHELMIRSGFDGVTCPYCNDSKIEILDISEENEETVRLKAYLDIDHFYPKSPNPFLALSYYNLIPSCTNCNSREKGNKEFCILTHNHPYLDSFDKRYFFRIDAKTMTDNDSLEIRLDYLDKTRLDFTNRDLNILNRYSGKNLKDAIKLKNLYQDYHHYLDVAEFEGAFKDLLLANIPIHSCEILKNINGKLNRDIIKQID
ncbi:MAG: hypothetical protein V7691_14565, partial [Galbibacter orientalis]